MMYNDTTRVINKLSRPRARKELKSASSITLETLKNAARTGKIIKG